MLELDPQRRTRRVAPHDLRRQPTLADSSGSVQRDEATVLEKTRDGLEINAAPDEAVPAVDGHRFRAQDCGDRIDVVRVFSCVGSALVVPTDSGACRDERGLLCRRHPQRPGEGNGHRSRRTPQAVLELLDGVLRAGGPSRKRFLGEVLAPSPPAELRTEFEIRPVSALVRSSHARPPQVGPWTGLGGSVPLLCLRCTPCSPHDRGHISAG